MIIHGFDTQANCLYDFEGQASQISIGALLENISIAASQYQLRINVQELQKPLDNFSLRLAVQFTSDSSLIADELIPFIEKRSVQRRPLSTRHLSELEKNYLEKSVGLEYQVKWITEASSKFRLARLLFRNGKLRLTIPEAFNVHQQVIEKNATYSIDRIPDKAVGLDPFTTRLMPWVMKSWSRANFFNKFLGGAIAPSIQLDFIPAMACGAHFFLKANKKPELVIDYLNAGRALQRFWLTCTKLNLQLQPEMTPLIFSKYVSKNKRFSGTPGLFEEAVKIKRGLEGLIGNDTLENTVFMGRVGSGKVATARSLRLSLDQLMIKKSD